MGVLQEGEKKPFKLLRLTWNHCCLCHLNLNFKRAKGTTTLHAFFYTANLYVLGGCTLLPSNPYPPILLFLLPPEPKTEDTAGQERINATAQKCVLGISSLN